MTFNMVCFLIAIAATVLFSAFLCYKSIAWKKDTVPSADSNFEKAMARGYADLKIMQEHERRKMQVKTWAENKLDREMRSGIVIDPGGTCLCRMCGHTVSTLHDHCINCCTPINWNA